MSLTRETPDKLYILRIDVVSRARKGAERRHPPTSRRHKPPTRVHGVQCSMWTVEWDASASAWVLYLIVPALSARPPARPCLPFPQSSPSPSANQRHARRPHATTDHHCFALHCDPGIFTTNSPTTISTLRSCSLTLDNLARKRTRTR